MERETDRKAVLIFVHGFGSSAECWTPLISLLKKNEQITNQYDWECFPRKKGRKVKLPEHIFRASDEIPKRMVQLQL